MTDTIPPNTSHISRERMPLRKYTALEWYRFDLDIQEALIKKYEVILTDYIPKKRIRIRRLNRKITKAISYIDKGVLHLNSGIASFDKMMNDFTKELTSQLQANDGKKLLDISTNTSSLFGKNSGHIDLFGTNSKRIDLFGDDSQEKTRKMDFGGTNIGFGKSKIKL